MDLVMAKERGKRTKKILHLFHLLIEFLRHIFTSSAVSVGKTATSESKNVVSKSKKTGKNVSKSASSKSSVIVKGSLAAGSTGASSISLTGLTAGTIISAKTLGMVLIVGTLFLGGLGTYSYITHQNPLNLFGALGKSQANTGNPSSNQPPTAIQPSSTNTPVQSSGYSSSSLSSSTSGNSYLSSQNSHQKHLNSNNTSLNDNGTTPPSINYTVP